MSSQVIHLKGLNRGFSQDTWGRDILYLCVVPSELTETISSVFTEWNYISSWITLYRDLSEIFFHFLVGNNNKRPDKSFQSTVFKLVNSTHVMSKTRSRKKGNALTVAKNSILWFDFINSDIETNLHLMQRLQIAASSHHKYQQERKKKSNTGLLRYSSLIY